MDAVDMLLWGVLAAFSVAAAAGWGELYSWFVEPAKHHTAASYSARSPSGPDE